MMERHVRHAGDVPEFHGTQRKAVNSQLLWNEAVEPLGEPELPETELDGKLPTARDAQEDLVVRVGDRNPRSPAERGRPFDPPEERVRVEQQLHSV